jgi:HAD superfamily hydrolase (TIGR01509 family)
MTVLHHYQAILWDNDGVIVDTERIFYQVNRDFFLEYGIELTPQHFFDWFLLDNCGAWHLLELSEKEIVPLRTERNRRYNQRLQWSESLAMPGIENTLQHLSSHLRMGIVTSSRREDFNTIHNKSSLLKYFEFVITEEDYARSKPAPDPYLLGLTKLGIPADLCLAIEDSPRGLLAATAAGIDCVIVRSELTQNCNFDGACLVVDSHKQLLEGVLTLRKRLPMS